MSLLGKKYYKDPDNGHACVIEIADMALGVVEIGAPVTAFKYKCVLCGREFTELTNAGIEQLGKYKVEEVLK